MAYNINTKLLLRILGRILLAANLITMIVLRHQLMHVSYNQHLMTQKWIRLAYSHIGKQIEGYFPTPAWAMENYSLIIKGYQTFDFVLVFLILVGTRVGPFILLLETTFLMILKGLFEFPTFDQFFANPNERTMGFFRELGVLGACLTLI